MDNVSKEEKMHLMLKQTSGLILELEKKRDSKIVSLIDFNYSLIGRVAYMLNKIVRKIKDAKKIDLFLESGGGSVDVAAKIAKICIGSSETFSVIVPFYAKSAASLTAIYAKELTMTAPAELGPIDPLIRHPLFPNHWIPAHSIKDCMSFLEGRKDAIVKLSLAERLDALMIGAYEDAMKGVSQYVEEVFMNMSPDQKQREAIETFTTRFRSHGYPIDRKICSEIGLKVKIPEKEEESLMFDLHESYLDFLIDTVDEGIIIQTSTDFHAILDGKVFTPSSLLPYAESK